ncbi:hypothetical protein BASA81_011045 [Batrachochytrium salamandrivorans]|nr:hypothetical protein BASA81_011045 [Batrachochytrium salamandrivorans]
MLPFTPLGNSTHPCAGLELREQNHPPSYSPLYRDFSIILFGIFTVLALACIWGVWRTRNHPRFEKVRPLPLSITGIVAMWLYVSGGTIAIVLEWSCTYIIWAEFFGIGFVATTLTLRLVVLGLEAQYAKLASTAMVFQGDESDVETSLGFAHKQVRAAKVLFRFVYWSVPLDNFTLQELMLAKSGYGLFWLLHFSPTLPLILVLIFAFPPYECAQHCHDLFLEVEISLICLLLYFTLFGAGVLYRAYNVNGWDIKGVLMEVFLIIGVVCAVALPVTGLAIADSDDLALNQVFSWQGLVGFTGLLHLWFSFGLQFLAAHLQSRRARQEDLLAATATMLTQMVSILARNPELKKEFDKFAAKQYVSESVQFLDDVAQFKHLYYDKPESWRAQKVRILVKHYITVGSDLEVNISFAARSKVLQRVSNETDLFDVFDLAAAEIRGMVQDGAWRDFIRTRQHSSLSFLVAAPSSPKA